MKRALLIVPILALSACAPPPPANPGEQFARQAAAYEVTARNCGGFAGGFSDITQMREQANMRAVLARQNGATQETIAKQTQIVQTTFDTMVAWVGPVETCRKMVSETAWNAM